jgi:hypothetical protein
LRNRNGHRDGVGHPGSGPGSYRVVDENGTVVAGDWANADGSSGLDFADHGEHELKGVPVAWRPYAVKGDTRPYLPDGGSGQALSVGS